MMLAELQWPSFATPIPTNHGRANMAAITQAVSGLSVQDKAGIITCGKRNRSALATSITPPTPPISRRKPPLTRGYVSGKSPACDHVWQLDKGCPILG